MPLVLSPVACGFPSPADDYLDRLLDFNELLIASPSATFAVRIAGESMRDADLDAARAFCGFWNTGDQALLDRALAASFTDHTLPDGRPQDPGGAAFASKYFQAAVPDLGVTIGRSQARQVKR